MGPDTSTKNAPCVLNPTIVAKINRHVDHHKRTTQTAPRATLSTDPCHVVSTWYMPSTYVPKAETNAYYVTPIQNRERCAAIAQIGRNVSASPSESMDPHIYRTCEIRSGFKKGLYKPWHWTTSSHLLFSGILV